jgi:4,5-DOPA dioxygenase extradiol
VDVAPRPRTIHDFRGFAPALSRIEYPAPGAVDLARTAEALLQAAGMEVAPAVERGLDHGAWVPLSLMFPAADIPVTQLSIQPLRDAAWHLAVGAALAPLRDTGVLILASGSLTHNLAALDFSEPLAEPDEAATEFAETVAAALERRDTATLLDWRRRLPHAGENHPTPEHLLPLFVALGAAGPDAVARRLHASHTYGSLAMDVYAFDAAG